MAVLEQAPPRALSLALPLTHGRALATFAFLLGCALLLFYDPFPVAPVALWDEARNANNAVEMAINGFGLVTTYGHQPDLWNTKPPLLIWLMSGSITLFGPSEWAIRLPSAVAAMGTLLCTILFVRRVTRSAPLAFGSATLLLLSPGFFGEHGARTADYDATLLFFVTAGLQLAFLLVHRVQPRTGAALLAGGLIGLGALTKSVAAFIPLPGLLLYLLVIGRTGWLARHWRPVAVGLAAAIGPLLLFMLLREARAPGYLEAVAFNDVFGRFSQSLLPEETGPFYYAEELIRGWFFGGPFLLAAPFVLGRLHGRKRALLLYSFCVAGGALLVYSAASTRAMQYALPIFPWLAIIGALAIQWLVQRYVLANWQSEQRVAAVMIAGGMLLVAGQLTGRAAYWRYQGFPERQFYTQAYYGDVFGALHARGHRHVIAVDPGIQEPTPSYAPLLDWNRSAWALRGMRIDRLLATPGDARLPLVSCEPNVFEKWRGSQVERVKGCAAAWPSQS